MYGQSGIDYRVATISISYLTNTEITHHVKYEIDCTYLNYRNKLSFPDVRIDGRTDPNYRKATLIMNFTYLVRHLKLFRAYWLSSDVNVKYRYLYN